jgi:metal-dependent amidase/aminoacylase/carboxypeptidase family protein
VRGNIIPDKVEMVGTIRILNPAMRDDILLRIKRTITSIATSADANAEVEIEAYAPITYNDPKLTLQMIPTLQKVAPVTAIEILPVTSSEDFSFYQQQLPGVYFFLDVGTPGPKTGCKPLAIF